MRIPLLIFSFLLSIMASAQLPSLSSGRIIRHTDFSSQFVSARNVDVWLPDSYNSNTKYSVLYMHDGQMLFDSAVTWNKQEWGVDETMGRLLNEQKITECIVVGIWNTPRRHMEYFPQKALNYLTQRQIDSLMNASRGEGFPPLFEGGIISDNYLKFLTSELKPFIDSAYNTKTDRNNTFIAGSSMGGLISMYALCEYPGIFGGAACLSTHWPGVFTVENNPIPAAFLRYMNDHLPDAGNHRLYFDFGTETLDALYEPFQKQADVIIRSKGYTQNDWTTRKFQGEDHSEIAWRKRLEIPLLFLLSK